MKLQPIFRMTPLLLVISTALFAINPKLNKPEPMITIETSDGQEMKIPENIALKSSVIKDLLSSEQATIAHSLSLKRHIDLPLPTIIPLPEVTKAELELIVQILLELNTMDETKIKRADGAYIAHRIQPTIDTVLAPINEPQIGAIIRAAQYLDLEYIVNGAIRELTQKALRANRQVPIDQIIAYLYSQRGRIKKPQYQPEGLITTLKPLFEKHYTLLTTGDRYRKEYGGAIPELSLADYIEITGMPTIENGGLNLSGKKISSLDGIDRINDISKVTTLVLSHNYLSSLSGDVFKAIPNLRVLYLVSNYISTLPASIFSHTPKLKNLYLSNNSLTQLPASLFQPIRYLEELLLNGNRISTLKEGIFNNLTKLKKLALDGNKFDYIAQTNSYPFPKNTFQPLVSLKELYILNNPFSKFINKYSFMARYNIPNDIHII